MSKTSLTIAAFLLLLFSCEEGFITDCNQCYSDDYRVILRIRYRNPDYMPNHPVVTLYEGKVSDSIVLKKFYITDPTSYIDYNAILYKDYSATLVFYKDGQKYIITAGACPNVRYDETSCEEPCYYLYDNILDLRLRYE
jgi:hypothetical protein